MNITTESVVRVVASSSRWRKVGESIVVMDLTNSTYFAVEGSVAHVWPKLVEGTRLGDVASELASEYEVDVELVENDLVQLAGDLVQRGVLSVDAD